VATALIRPLAWEPPYAVGVAQEMAKRQKDKKTKKNVLHFEEYPSYPYRCFYISVLPNRHAIQTVYRPLLSAVNIFTNFSTQ